MALIALLFAATLTADPPRLVLGKDAGANLEVKAPAGAKVTITANVGSVGEVRREGDAFKARYTPPAVRAPSVALLLARIDEGGDRELAWLAIPLSGSDTMEIETRPGAKVVADVAGHSIGPVVADARGMVRLPMVVPPGVDKATLHITDKLGNTTEKPLDLEPPPFSRMRVAPRSDGASAVTPMEVEIFVVRRDGTPDDRAAVELEAKEGDAEVRKRIGHGVYLGRFTAPPKKSGTVHLTATANGEEAGLDAPVVPANLLIARAFWKSALSAERPWAASVGLIGGGGSTFGGALAGTIMLEAAMRIEVMPVEVLIDGGFSWFGTVDQPGATPGTTDSAHPHTGFILGGVRVGRQLVRDVDGHVTLAFGASRQSVTRRIGATGAEVAAEGWTPRFAASFGANLRIGPGRALAQLQLDATGSNVAGLTSNLSGVQLMAGYLVTVR